MARLPSHPTVLPPHYLIPQPSPPPTVLTIIPPLARHPSRIPPGNLPTPTNTQLHPLELILMDPGMVLVLPIYPPISVTPDNLHHPTHPGTLTTLILTLARSHRSLTLTILRTISPSTPRRVPMGMVTLPSMNSESDTVSSYLPASNRFTSNRITTGFIFGPISVERSMIMVTKKPPS